MQSLASGGAVTPAPTPANDIDSAEWYAAEEDIYVMWPDLHTGDTYRADAVVDEVMLAVQDAGANVIYLAQKGMTPITPMPTPHTVTTGGQKYWVIRLSVTNYDVGALEDDIDGELPLTHWLQVRYDLGGVKAGIIETFTFTESGTTGTPGLPGVWTWEDSSLH